MGLLDQKTSHVPELQIIDAGTETRFTIIEAEIRTGKDSGREFFAITQELTEFPNAGHVYATVMGLKKGDDPKKADNMLRRLRRFKQAIGLDPDHVFTSAEELIGKGGFAIYGQEDTDTGKRNVMKRYSVSQAG